MKIYMSNIEQIKNIAELEQKLSKSELVQYDKFSNNNRKLQYLLAHAIVKDVCGENISVDKNGVPSVKSGFVSIAHKDNWVVVAISNNRVGLDIENTNINRDFVGQSELLNLPISKDKDVFYKNFVKYESMFKYGKSASGKNIYFYKMENYLIGICSIEKASDIEFVLSGAGNIHFVCAE